MPPFATVRKKASWPVAGFRAVGGESNGVIKFRNDAVGASSRTANVRGIAAFAGAKTIGEARVLRLRGSQSVMLQLRSLPHNSRLSDYSTAEMLCRKSYDEGALL